MVEFTSDIPGAILTLLLDIERDFPIMETHPQWLQGAEWPFQAGRPLCSVGQLDVAVKRDGHLRRTTFYVFWNPQTGESKTIQQHD